MKITQEDKQLLLADLCARLPYGVICEYTSIQPGYELYNEIGVLESIQKDYQSYKFVIDGHLCGFSDFKPYLRPMTSMTEEEFESLKEYSGLKYEQLDLASYQNGTYKCLDFYLSEVPSYVVILVFDWLNSHHFDYRGLIERELAIAVTEENNPYK